MATPLRGRKGRGRGNGARASSVTLLMCALGFSLFFYLLVLITSTGHDGSVTGAGKHNGGSSPHQFGTERSHMSREQKAAMRKRFLRKGTRKKMRREATHQPKFPVASHKGVGARPKNSASALPGLKETQAVELVGARDDDEVREREEQARVTLEPLAPLVLKIDVCNGLTNQRIALVDGIVMGLTLGTQILLPDSMPFNGVEMENIDIERQMKPLSEMFDMKTLAKRVDELYQDYWCGKRLHEPQSAWWCGQNPYHAFVTESSAAMVMDAFFERHGVDSSVKILSIEADGPIDGQNVLTYRRMLYNSVTSSAHGERGQGVLDAKCTLFRLRVVEGESDLWELFWKVDDALHFIDDVHNTANQLMSSIESYGPLAKTRAEARGFVPLGDAVFPGRAFNVLHLRAEEDWIQHCRKWMGLRDGVHRDNCMNNTMAIGNILVTEGLDPRIPLYISTGLSDEELSEMSIPDQFGDGFESLSESFTIVTKESIMGNAPPFASREQWAAVDSLIADAASEFVGNSVSTFSAYIMTARQRRGLRAWHYNGGGVPLHAAGFLTPSVPMAISTFREPLKWVFQIHTGTSQMSSSFEDMVKVAVMSNRRHTSLVPVCVTTSHPLSALSRFLVSLGVRVIHHSPAWADAMRRKVLGIKRRNEMNGHEHEQDKSHLYGDPDAMIGTFMRIDLPIIGLLDDFVLYTDVDVMFKSEIDWGVLLGSARFPLIKRANDFTKGRWDYAPPGQPGLPLFLSASSEMSKSTRPEFLNAGVMLLNMRNLRDTYDAFKKFILSSDDLHWPEGPGDQGAYKVFYRTDDGTPHANFLPWTLNWKTYWEPNPEAKLIHFHGPKCKRDIEPFQRTGEVHMDVFKGILVACQKTGDCAALCREFASYLDDSASTPSMRRADANLLSQ